MRQPTDGGPPAQPIRPPMAVVALGASAGGLEALEQFFAAAPPDSGLAFVVVQHLERRHPSLLAELLGRATSMPVKQIADGDALEPDCVFVIPPNTTLGVASGILRLTPPAAEPRTPIDAFFRALAEDGGDLAVGVLLSGTGTDGALGLRAIKEQGGFTLAQAPETAKHPSMPEHAIAAGFVDEVLAPPAMPSRLLEHAAHLARSARGSAAFEAEVGKSLSRICNLLRRSTGHDFSRYKEGTLLRRIRRRIQLARIQSTAEYIERLSRDPEEPRLLLRDLLIGVTQFFREPAAFEVLAEKVVPKLLEDRSTDRPIRIWVPGCATGEEVYSIAMLVDEQLAASGTARGVQLFATDIDAEALAIARTGRYRADIAEQVSPERLERFFIRTENGYQVIKELRELCVFSAHNLIRDPPFSSIDLISCRNLLIYLEPDLQRKVVPLLHYALRRSGFLFLGSSEELGGSELFVPLDKRRRVFQRKDTLVRPMLDFPPGGLRSSRGTAAPTEPEPGARTPKQTVLQAFERMLLDHFAPAAAIVDEQGEMLCLGGNREPLLRAPAGLLTSNLLDHTEGTLRHALRTALAEAVARKALVGSERLADVAGVSHRLRVTVRPAPGAPPQSGLYAVVIEDLGPARAPAVDATQALSRDPMIEQLENELKTTRADLQAANEELEGAIEELKSSNEELISTNEELQSTNEELQTSKEELQSLNEELETVNAELRQKVNELGVLNSDLQNLFSSTQVATIFLDRELKVAKFTPAATTLFSFIDADVGRPLADLAPRFAGTDLPADVNEVLRTLVPVEREIRAGQAWFILRVMPYRTLDDAIAGAVITFGDVTKLKRIEAALREGERLLKDVIDGSPSPVLLKDLQGRFLTANRRMETLVGHTREQLKGKTDYDLFPRETAEHYREHDRRVAESRQPIDFEEVAELSGGRHVFLASKFPLLDSAGRIYGVGTITTDITERKRIEEDLRETEERFRALFEHARDAILVTDPAGSGKVLSANPAACALLGYSAEEILRLDRDAMFESNDPGLVEVLRRREEQGSATAEITYRRKDGSRFPGELATASFVDRNGRRLAIAIVRDITVRRRTEDALREADRHKSEFLAMLSHELRNPLAPIRNSLYLLEHGDPDAERQRRAQSVIRRQVDHLVRLVEDLLDITRITRGMIRLEKEPLELSELLDRTIEDHRALFADAGIELSCRSQPGLWAEADSTRLSQVVGNLLQNAVKFTPRGGAVSVSLEPSGDGQAVIRVRDTGAGMSPEIQERVFHPFTQADRTLDRTKGGLGLGLALVKALVELHGGSVSARSEGPGKGAELEVVLPTLPARAPQRAAAEPPREGDLVSRRVLIIEDNRDAADSLREVLELGNHSVEVAYSGPDGLEKARGFRPDVVLCDIGLPGMDGLEVARAMRADAALASVRLVALTGYAGPEDIARSREVGFDDHLSKPPSIEALERVLTGPVRSHEVQE